ncbi:protein Red-like [Epargyreus clarus]|uniref:protein Red-like n=1 Tax=Epargyreus clarus TaxID=520877 RepID=UPI003C30B4EF
MEDHRSVEDTPASQRLTNDDFRKLLMTPRSTPSGGAHPAGSVREAMANSGSMPPPIENKSELRRKKKSYYAALKKQEDNKLAELAEKYRDRARERRDGTNRDLGPTDPTSNTSSAYRAVAPDVKSGMDAKERRRQMIQESKYLGGDMEHTHLVKGLDYALLQKVRSEIQTREQEQEAEMERLVSIPIEPVKEKKEVIPVSMICAKFHDHFKNVYDDPCGGVVVISV